jgi:cholesterol transport system auxiliary component
MTLCLRRHSFLGPVVAVLAVTMAGCITAAREHERKYYMLQVVRQGPPVPVRSNATLKVRRFDVDTAFAGKGFVYRIGEFQYESDYYYEFLVPPGTMIAEQTRGWLADSGLFQRSPLESTYLLEGNVTGLYGDFTNEAAPEAVLEIRFFLVGSTNASETAVFARTYRAVTPVPARTAEAFIGALSHDLAQILMHLEADLQKTLVSGPAESTPAGPSPGA